MIQNLLEDRFRLKLHLVKKEMPTYDLTVAETGAKLKETPPGAASQPSEDPWTPPQFTVGKDGYPVFPTGRGGVAGSNGHYRWVAFHVPMREIVKTLSFYLGRPVVDGTGLTGNYDVDLRWWLDLSWILERSGYAEEAKNLPDRGPTGPALVRAVRDQLGLTLTAKKGFGSVVVIDRLESVSAGN